jgi:hypothetical protein
MKKVLPLLLVALIFGIGGYVIGGIQTGLKTAIDSDTATLMWITEIDRAIQSGNIKRANYFCFTAATAHFDLIKRLNDHPASMMLMISIAPWLHYMEKPNQIILTRAKQFYAPRASEMTLGAKAYLESIQEVPLPHCDKSTNSPAP